MRRDPHIDDLARWQRKTLWLVIVAVIATCIAVLLNLPLFRGVSVSVTAPLGVLYVVLSLALVVAIMALQAAMGTHPIFSIIVGLLAIVPFLSLFVLLLVNMEASNVLKNAGLTVGLMGVDPDEVKRALNPMLCRKCGYDLTGNMSGRCPECGFYIVHTEGGVV